MLSALKAANGLLNGAALVCPSSPASGDRGGRTSLRLEPRLTRLAAMTILLFGLLGQQLLAGDSWEKKPYDQWTEPEALKVLQDSAWSKLSFVWANSEAQVARPESKSTGGEVHSEEHSNCCRTFTRIVDGASTEDSPVDSASPGGPVPIRQVLSYRVLLYSSARIRQALVRLSQIRGGIWDVQADASLQKPMEDLVIAVAGPNMEPFDNTTGELIVGSTYLRSRKGGREKVVLKDFVPPGARQDGLALFVFSRKVDGKPAFSVADDQIEFGTGEGAFRIRAVFKLEKMVVNGVPDF
jgi:hypothetical protein